MVRVINEERPQKLGDVQSLSQADSWLKEVSRNLAPDIMQRIQNGSLTEEEKASPKINVVQKAWQKFHEYSGGAFTPAAGGTLHRPV